MKPPRPSFGPELLPNPPAVPAGQDCLPFALVLTSAVAQPSRLRMVDEREEYDDVRTAIYQLRHILGYSIEEFGTRLELPANKYALIEKSGKALSVFHLDRMKAMCWEHGLVKMWQYFDRQVVLLGASKPPKQRVPKNRFDK